MAHQNQLIASRKLFNRINGQWHAICNDGSADINQGLCSALH